MGVVCYVLLMKTSFTRYVIESCDGFLWEEEYHFDTLEEARIEIDRMRSSINTRKFRIVRQQWEVIEEGK